MKMNRGVAMRGYAHKFIQDVRGADQSKLGVQLGMACIEGEIPVSDVAEFFKVTRATVYNWFKGKTKVPTEHTEKIEKLIAGLGT
jgi:DNA-binding transcriptional regulator YdaS (Cro superfamily)